MKKTFKIAHPKIKVARMFEAIKYEVKKYLKRERRKSLPEGVDYWDFDCRYATIYPVISNVRSGPSSITTTTNATMRA